MPITPDDPFHGRHDEADIILTCVRWDLDLPLSYCHVAKLIRERGLTIHLSCVFRWGQVYAPEVNKRCRLYLRPTNKSYRVDETYIKAKGPEKYLYRTVDSLGQTNDFLLTAKRNKTAARRFFHKVFRSPANPIPRVIDVEKNAAYPAAIKVLKREQKLPRRVCPRQCKYLDNGIEQDHRLSKKRGWLAKGYKTFPSARRTLEGIETMPRIRQGRVRRVAKKDVVAGARFVVKPFGLDA